MRDNVGRMEGRRVNVYLKTPLFRFKYVSEGKERHLLENTVRLQGTVKREAPAGVELEVEQVSNLKVVEKDLPFREIFIPYDKIDHIIYLD